MTSALHLRRRILACSVGMSGAPVNNVTAGRSVELGCIHISLPVTNVQFWGNHSGRSMVRCSRSVRDVGQSFRAAVRPSRLFK